jgi:hypothetical protein
MVKKLILVCLFTLCVLMEEDINIKLHIIHFTMSLCGLCQLPAVFVSTFYLIILGDFQVSDVTCKPHDFFYFFLCLYIVIKLSVLAFIPTFFLIGQFSEFSLNLQVICLYSLNEFELGNLSVHVFERTFNSSLVLVRFFPHIYILSWKCIFFRFFSFR